MAVFKCGHCGVKGHFTPCGNGVVSRDLSTYQFEHCEQALSCDSCERLTIAMSTDWDYADYVTGGSSDWGTFWNHCQVDDHFPKWVQGRDFKVAPSHIADAASEAHRVFSIGAFRATAILCRATLEAVCKDKDAEGKDLFKKIDDLHEKGKIRSIVKETAHVLRAIGNDMAHGDFDSELDQEDASDILDFLDSIINEIYESPAQLARMQANVEARKNISKAR